MCLIEQFNAFQTVSEVLELSANTRSVFYAILAEFNRARYPRELKIANIRVQHLSGVTSSHSFETARQTLINAGVIKHKKQVYELCLVREGAGNFSGNERKDSDSATSPVSVEREREREKEKTLTTTTTTTRARSFVSSNSPEVVETWFNCEGEHLRGGNAFGLIELENQYGVETVCAAIIKASQANTEPRLSFNFVKAVLNNMLKGGEKRGKDKAVRNSDVWESANAGESWESERPSWLD